MILTHNYAAPIRNTLWIDAGSVERFFWFAASIDRPRSCIVSILGSIFVLYALRIYWQYFELVTFYGMKKSTQLNGSAFQFALDKFNKKKHSNNEIYNLSWSNRMVIETRLLCWFSYPMHFGFDRYVYTIVSATERELSIKSIAILWRTQWNHGFFLLKSLQK